MKHENFEWVIFGAIFVNSLVLAIETYLDSGNTEDIAVKITNGIDIFFTAFFALEAFLKAFTLGFVLNKGSYLRETWS